MSKILLYFCLLWMFIFSVHAEEDAEWVGSGIPSISCSQHLESASYMKCIEGFENRETAHYFFQNVEHYTRNRKEIDYMIAQDCVFFQEDKEKQANLIARYSVANPGMINVNFIRDALKEQSDSAEKEFDDYLKSKREEYQGDLSNFVEFIEKDEEYWNLSRMRDDTYEAYKNYLDEKRDPIVIPDYVSWHDQDGQEHYFWETDFQYIEKQLGVKGYFINLHFIDEHQLLKMDCSGHSEVGVSRHDWFFIFGKLVNEEFPHLDKANVMAWEKFKETRNVNDWRGEFAPFQDLGNEDFWRFHGHLKMVASQFNKLFRDPGPLKEQPEFISIHSPELDMMFNASEGGQAGLDEGNEGGVMEEAVLFDNEEKQVFFRVE